MGEAGRASAIERDWSAINGRLVRSYRELLDQHGSPAASA
jgi:hypothetical protein